MLKISLEKMHFRGAHGLYPEERLLGSEYEVDVWVAVDDPGGAVTLDRTVDYEKVYALVAGVMAHHEALLETLADQCAVKIRETFPGAREAQIRIAKLHPPLGGRIERSVVTLTRAFPGS